MSGENDGAERSRRVRRKTPIDAVDERGTAPFEISSPRSLRALSHCALTNAQLQYRSLESYEGSGVPKQVAKLSFESGEDRRRQRIALVKKEYRALCRYSPGAGRSAHCAAAAGLRAALTDGRWVRHVAGPSTTKASSLCCLTSLRAWKGTLLIAQTSTTPKSLLS